MEDIVKFIKIEMVKNDVPSVKELCRRIGWNDASFYSRVKNGSMRVADLEKMADVMDCDLDIKFISRKS